MSISIHSWSNVSVVVLGKATVHYN